MTALHRLSLLGAALALAGCASVSPDGLRGDVGQLTAGRTAGVQAALPAADAAAKAQTQESIQRWLAEPLTQDAAVRIALLNNPGLQARLAALGVADAERVQAITLPNPHFTLGALPTAMNARSSARWRSACSTSSPCPGAPNARPSACRLPPCRPRKTW